MNIVAQQLIGVLVLACVPVGLIVYGRLIYYVRRKGGRVKTDSISLVDAVATAVILGYFALLVVLAMRRPGVTVATKPTADQALSSLVFFFGMLLLLLAFLKIRYIDLRRFFGLHRLHLGRALVLAFGFVLSAYPLVLLVGWITQTRLGADAREQELVGLFRDAAARLDTRSVARFAVAAAIGNPIVEEVFFRGYFYVVGKRFLGGIASAVFTSALFAAAHTNLTSFPSLFVLALCLTLAYEVTGTILVPIGMHMLFNSSQLAFLAWQARQ